VIFSHVLYQLSYLAAGRENSGESAAAHLADADAAPLPIGAAVRDRAPGDGSLAGGGALERPSAALGCRGVRPFLRRPWASWRLVPVHRPLSLARTPPAVQD
jgi:hypothetical protein